MKPSLLYPALLALVLCLSAQAANIEPPPDPGFGRSTIAADVIAEVEIVAGGPFRAVAILRKAIKGTPPKIFEIEGHNSYNWDTVHHGLAAGTRCILFLSTTERPDTFAALTPAAPRLITTSEGTMVAFGDPPVRFPVKPASLEDALSLMVEKNATGKIPERAGAAIRDLWEQSEIEARYLAVELAGALRDPRAVPLVIEASRDKLLKLRQRAIEALGKIGTPEAFAALQGLLKDEKKTISRDAARALALSRDTASVPLLLEWVRKNAGGAAKGAEQARIDSAATEIIALARASAHFNDSEKIARDLLDIARIPNDRLAGDALEAAATVAPAFSVPTLVELALDRTYDQRDRALYMLQRIALKPVRSVDEFQAWWREAGKRFNEDARRDAAESAARALPTADDFDERRKHLEILRYAPGAIAAVSASPFLLKTKESSLMDEEELLRWNTPLAAPFLIERLGRDGISTRRSAFEALVTLCDRHPRLNAALWPLLRAHLAERDTTVRYDAETAAAQLAHTDAVDALLDALASRSTTEQNYASKALFALSARTFGFSLNEPVPDQHIAVAHLRGWWESAREKFRPLALTIPLNPYALFPDESTRLRVFESLPPAEQAAKLEALTLAEESSASEAAFAALWSQRGADDAFWKKLLSQRRLRDRARGMLGALGSPALAADSKKLLNATNGADSPPLLKALALLSLGAASQSTENSAAGAKEITAWLKGPGEKAALPLKRLAVACLALADKEPESLALLGTLLDGALKADPPDANAVRPDDDEYDYALMRATVLALCARSDSNALLLKLLEETKETRLRETAARALSLRRERGAIPGIVRALEKADRWNWLDYAHNLQPLVNAGDNDALLDLLDGSKSTARAAAVWLIAHNDELGRDPKTRAKLIALLNDDSSLVRYWAADALGKRRAKAALDALVKALEDTDDTVRASAAQNAIGEIGDRDACDAVVKAAPYQFQIDNRWMKALAIAESAKYFDMIMKFANSNIYTEQRAGLEALAPAAIPAAKERLMKAFRSDDEPLQTVAANLLAQRGDALLPMIQLDLSSPDKAARARAYHLLSRLKTAKSQAVLKAVFNTEEDLNLKTLIGWALSRAANPDKADERR